MTPKENAEYLMKRIYLKLNIKMDNDRFDEAKQCTLICVDEMISELNTCSNFYVKNSYYQLRIYYLDEVKQELEKL